jgi:hypothetical protein
MKSARTPFQVLCHALIIVAAAALSAQAGPNGGGTIFLHDAQLDYTTDVPSYCGLGTAPGSCAGADVEIDGTFGGHSKVFKAYAAFLEGTSPRLKGMAFGIHYSPYDLAIVAAGACIGDRNNGAAEIQGPGWPGDDTGTTIVFQWTQTTQLVEFYWFAAYRYSANPSVFRLRSHPDPILGGNFVDDAIPGVQDPITGYGSIGFDTPGQTACPTGEGACCDLAEGTCSITTPQECNSQENHDYNGGPSCDPMPCPTDAPCCLVDPFPHCQVMPPADCRAGGNLVVGLCGEVCTDPSPCGYDDLGACCEGEICTVTPERDCYPPGIWIRLQPCYPGPDNPCLETWGACCIGDVCLVTPERDCPGGPEHWYSGRRCDDPVVPCADLLGACCTLAGDCILIPQSACVPPNIWNGSHSCDPNPCPLLGACCDQGDCTITTEAECGGQWLGPHFDCNPNPCEDTPGACCIGLDCTITTEPECGGTWIGPQYDCDPNPCDLTPGACCIGPECTITSEADCRGQWLGPQYDCDPNPCMPPGACCIGGECTIRIQPACGGTWLGPWTDCDPNPCEQPTGACCNLDTRECVVLTAQECDQQTYPHQYMGDYTTCDPNPCPVPVPVRQSTWGRIKAGYR